MYSSKLWPICQYGSWWVLLHPANRGQWWCFEACLYIHRRWPQVVFLSVDFFSSRKLNFNLLARVLSQTGSGIVADWRLLVSSHLSVEGSGGEGESECNQTGGAGQEATAKSRNLVFFPRLLALDLSHWVTSVQFRLKKICSGSGFLLEDGRAHYSLLCGLLWSATRGAVFSISCPLSLSLPRFVSIWDRPADVSHHPRHYLPTLFVWNSSLIASKREA